MTGTGRSKAFIKFEIFDCHICFGFIFVVFFCGNSKIIAFFGEGGGGGGEVILKFKPKVFGKYIVILGVAVCNFYFKVPLGSIPLAQQNVLLFF